MILGSYFATPRASSAIVAVKETVLPVYTRLILAYLALRNHIDARNPLCDEHLSHGIAYAGG